MCFISISTPFGGKPYLPTWQGLPTALARPCYQMGCGGLIRVSGINISPAIHSHLSRKLFIVCKSSVHIHRPIQKKTSRFFEKSSCDNVSVDTHYILIRTDAENVCTQNVVFKKLFKSVSLNAITYFFYDVARRCFDAAVFFSFNVQ